MVLEPKQPYSDVHRTSEERDICFDLRSEMECSGSKGREFWILLSIFVRSLATSTPPALHTIERCVLPLLDRLDFLWDCTDLRALRTLIYHLELAGLQLPFHTRQALACELIRRALACGSVSGARGCVDFAKIIVNHNFHAVVGAIEEAALPFIANEKQDRSDSDHMLAVVEEEVCWYICEDSRLYEYIFEEKYDANGLDNNRIRLVLQKALRSRDSAFRHQVLRLVAACSFNSKSAFLRLAPIMETALYLEDFKAREYVLTVFMDVIYMHHHALKFEEIEHLLVPFLYSSTAKMQYAAVIGNGRLLLYNCFPEETEYLLSAMFERYVYEIPPQCSSLNESLEPVLKAMHIFFQDYSGGKDLHQDEIANTLVFMCLKKLDEGVVLINELRNLMHDSPNKKTEARKLRLAVRFGLSLCDNGLETVMASLAININSRFNNVMLLKEDCLSWFLLN